MATVLQNLGCASVLINSVEDHRVGWTALSGLQSFVDAVPRALPHKS
jgi:hypothetical protein